MPRYFLPLFLPYGVRNPSSNLSPEETRVSPISSLSGVVDDVMLSLAEHIQELRKRKSVNDEKMLDTMLVAEIVTWAV
jgi:hypothetical protein